jgi:hypothetical protein
MICYQLVKLAPITPRLIDKPVLSVDDCHVEIVNLYNVCTALEPTDRPSAKELQALVGSLLASDPGQQ